MGDGGGVTSERHHEPDFSASELALERDVAGGGGTGSKVTGEGDRAALKTLDLRPILRRCAAFDALRKATVLLHRMSSVQTPQRGGSDVNQMTKGRNGYHSFSVVKTVNL